jgi:D-sedoheptulose 7-phosphate isomerase
MSSVRPIVDDRGLRQYFATLSDLLVAAQVTSAGGRKVDYAEAVSQLIDRALSVHQAGNKLIFVGNGGSAAIASHMATDFSKNGNVRALALNDGAMLTCLGNDLGYDSVFARQIELHAQAGDMLVAISSSGRSANILNAVAAARSNGCAVITLSGFDPDNPLRRLGDLNFFIGSDRYGFVEIGHLAICHAALDFLCGSRSTSESNGTRAAV